MSIANQQEVAMTVPAVTPMTATQYINWVKAKDVPAGATNVMVVDASYEPPPQLPINPVPTVITMRQARLALHQSGLLSQVDASIAAMPEASRIEWQFATTVERTHPLVAALSAALPLTSQQLDDLFTLGATL